MMYVTYIYVPVRIAYITAPNFMHMYHGLRVRSPTPVPSYLFICIMFCGEIHGFVLLYIIRFIQSFPSELQRVFSLLFFSI
jgi:hypothetical protein